MINADLDLVVSGDVGLKHRVFSVFQLIGINYSALPESKLFGILDDYEVTREDLDKHLPEYVRLLKLKT